MKDIVASTTEVLAKLKENRNKHVADHKKVMEGWRTSVANAVVLLARYVSSDEDLDPQKLYLDEAGEKPESHVEDYDTAIAMLELHQEKEITLSAQDVTSYMLDQWGWKHSFLISSSKYSV